MKRSDSNKTKLSIIFVKKINPFLLLFFVQSDDIGKIKCKKEPGNGRVVAKGTSPYDD